MCYSIGLSLYGQTYPRPVSPADRVVSNAEG